MFVSQRYATRLLGHLGLSRQAALRVLRTGAAGAPIRSGGCLVYEKRRVLDLIGRDQIFESGLPEVCSEGLFVARTTVVEHALAAACGPGLLSVGTRISLALAVEKLGFAPMVVTVSGFVAAGAELVGLRPADVDGAPSARVTLVVREAGEWYHALSGRWLWTPPGNRWLLLSSGATDGHLGRLGVADGHLGAHVMRSGPDRAGNV